LVGSAVFLVVDTATGGAADSMASWVMVATALLVAGLLFVAVRAVGHGQRGARAPLIVWQLMQFGVAKLTVGTPWFPVGVFLLVLAVIVFFGSFFPGVYVDDAPAAD
jgi:hypothetical protein